MVQRNRQLTVCRCQKVKTVYRGGDGMNKLYDLLKYIIYASFYVIVREYPKVCVNLQTDVR